MNENIYKWNDIRFLLENELNKPICFLMLPPECDPLDAIQHLKGLTPIRFSIIEDDNNNNLTFLLMEAGHGEAYRLNTNFKLSNRHDILRFLENPRGIEFYISVAITLPDGSVEVLEPLGNNSVLVQGYLYTTLSKLQGYNPERYN